MKFKCSMFLINLIKSYQHRKYVKAFKKNVLLKGDNYEFICCNATLKYGSTSENIILGDNISLLEGCNLVSTHKGTIILGDNVKFQRGITIMCVDRVEIGDYTAIASNVVITDNNNHPINPEFRLYMRTTPHGSDARSWIHADHAPIRIGKNCWIGQNSRIQKGVIIGDNCIVAANAVVTKSVPENCIVAGNPAKIVKTDIDKIPAPTSCESFNLYIANKR